MGTANFSYDNRCVVISDEDYELGNLPATGKYFGNNRSYPCVEVDTELNTDFYKIVITNGYYSGACLDFSDAHISIYDLVGYGTSYNSIASIKSDLESRVFNFKPKFLVKAVEETKDIKDKKDRYIDIVNRVEEFVKQYEHELCNKEIDRLKEYYGYVEVAQVARFSNGGAIYKKI